MTLVTQMKQLKRNAPGVRGRRRGLSLALLAIASLAVFAGGLLTLAGASLGSIRSGGHSDVLTQAKVAFVDGDFAKAIDLARVAGSRPGAEILLARALHESGHLAEAAKVFASIVEHDPENFQALRGMGRIYKEQGSLDLAIVHLRKAAQVRSDDPRIWRELGLAQEEAGDITGSLASLRKSLSLRPDQADLVRKLSGLAMGGRKAYPGPGGSQAVRTGFEVPQMAPVPGATGLRRRSDPFQGLSTPGRGPR